MKKYLIYSDMHWSKNSSILIGKGNKYSVRLENCIKTLNWIYDLAKKENCERVISAGDFFDKSILNSEEITALKEVNFTTPTTYLIGNHEASTLDLSLSSTNVFNDEIIYEQKVIPITNEIDLVYLPYITTASSINLGDFIKKDGKRKIVISHNDIAGIQYEGGLISQSGFDKKSILDNCDLFLNGHLHNKKIIDKKIFILGNITGKGFNENALVYKHCAYILSVNGNKIKISEVENPCALNFVTCDQDKVDQVLSIPNLVLKVKCDSDASDLQKKLSNNNIIAWKIVLSDKNKCILVPSEFKQINYYDEFVSYVKDLFSDNDIVKEELSRAIGG